MKDDLITDWEFDNGRINRSLSYQERKFLKGTRDLNREQSNIDPKDLTNNDLW